MRRIGPHGAPDAVEYGNGVWPVYTFDTALRPHETYATRQNNGNYWLPYVLNGWNTNGTLNGVNEGYGPGVPWNSMTWMMPRYSYDALNRLTAVNDSYIRNFSYDEFGSMAVAGNGNYNVPLSSLTPYAPANPFNKANNRLVGVPYDNAGNVTQMGSLSATYNPEGELLQSYDSVSQTTLNYTYDANGERVLKEANGATDTVTVRDAFGRVAAEYRSVGITPACVTCYLSYDHLGSVQLITDQTAGIVARHDFLPYGEEVMNGTGGRSGNGFSAASNVNQEFTGQERDETSLDFFHARYLSGVTGRFMSPDPGNAGADLLNPQSWNMYAYVGGNPMNATDPTGMDSVTDPPPPVWVPCPGCTVTVPSGPIDPITGFPAYYPNCEDGSAQCWGGSQWKQPSSSSGSGTAPAAPPAKPQNLAPPAKPGIGIRAPGQTFKVCMVQHGNDYSLVGLVDTSYGLATGKDSSLSTNPLASFFLGNSINTLLYGSGGETALTALSNVPSVIAGGMGNAFTYGRRTSDIMALNLAGRGGLPVALGRSSVGVKAVIGEAGSLLSLGLSFIDRMGIDVAFSGAEALDCSMTF